MSTTVPTLCRRGLRTRSSPDLWPQTQPCGNAMAATARLPQARLILHGSTFRTGKTTSGCLGQCKSLGLSPILSSFTHTTEGTSSSCIVCECVIFCLFVCLFECMPSNMQTQVVQPSACLALPFFVFSDMRCHATILFIYFCLFYLKYPTTQKKGIGALTAWAGQIQRTTTQQTTSFT